MHINTESFFLTIFGNGLLISLVAILIERIIIIYGLVRGNAVGLIVASFLLVTIKQLLDPDGSFIVYGLFFVLAGPIGVNRYDLIQTIKSGRWWWLSN